MDAQTNEERQQDELEFLQCVYLNDFEDLRKNDPFQVQRPPEIMIYLTPQKSISTSVRKRLQVSIKLYARYSSDYPDSPPELKLLEPNLLSDDLAKDLLQEINYLANERIGEVMMLEIAQHVQSFLHKHDRPPVSLHEEMVKRREKEAREESLRKYQQLELMRKQDEKEKEQIEKELQRRQAEVMEKVKQWQESEESSGSNDSLLDIVYDQELKPFTNALLPAKESSDKNKDINILRGKCLGDSALGGYTVYGGMDCDTGQLVVLYEWTILFKAASKKGDTRRMKQVSSIKQEFDSLIEKNIKHNCLVNYLSMRHQVTNQSIIVEIALEHINGGNLTGVLRNNHVGPYSLQTLHYFSKQLLEGLSYLHLQGIVHNDLRPSLVFVDPDEGAKLAGYTIVKRLSDLSKFTGRIRNGDEGVWSVGFSDGRGGKKSDIFKMGIVILSMAIGSYNITYPPDIPDYLNDMLKDFLKKCLTTNELERFPAHELLVHPFITPSLQNINFSKFEIHTGVSRGMETVSVVARGRNDSDSGGSQLDGSNRSRLQMEFEVLEVLGKGGFGDVIKVRNYLDGRLYAIKKVKLEGGSKMMAKLTREVELLSQMNHENVVRYYNAWIETYIEPTQTDQLDDSSNYTDISSDSDSEESSDGDDFLSIADDNNTISFVEFNSKVSQSTPATKDDKSDEDEDFFTSKLPSDSSEVILFQGSSSDIENNAMLLISESLEEKNDPNVHQTRSFQVKYLYIQMEFCPKQTLKQLIDSGHIHKQPHFELGWQLFREITEGLAHIHSQGMIHRDLKPGNIFLDSVGHVKIGDFGLATTFNKHPSKQTSILSNSSILAGDTGLVGTMLYLAPELLRPLVKYTQKVDIYSLGIIFYEMSHPPVSTLMERAKILTEIRKKEIIFSEYFDQVNMSNQAHVIRWLLNHIPSERPTSNELLNSPHIPYKIQEDLLQEAVIHTLQNPNSARYRYLMKKLFSSQAVSKYVEMAFFVDHYHQLDSESSLLKQNQSSYILLQQFVWTTVENIFIRHCGWRIKLPLLDPNSHLTNNECSVKMLEPTGKLLYLPIDHWVSFSRYVLQHDITFLKRYDDFIAYYPPSIPGTHPKELRRYVFDIVNTTNANRFICIAELMCMILEIMSELNIQGILRINHTSLLTALLTFCSVDTDQHDVVLQFLYNVCNGNNKISDIEKHFKDALHVHLSPLALKTLVKFITSQVPLEEIRSLLDPLLKSRTTVSSVVEKAVKEVEVLQDHLNTFQDNPKVLFYPGLVLNLSYFQGIIFEAILTRSQTVNKTRGKKQTQLLAIGGSYNKLLESVKQYNRSSSLLPSQYNVHNITICGVSINEDILLKRLMNVYGDGQISAPISKCHALICSVSGDTPFTKEGISLVTELRDKGAAVEFLLEHMNLESIQEFCRHRLIPHLIVLDNTLLLRQQVKVRTLDIGKEKVISERILHRSEVFDYIQSRYSNEKSSDLVESGIFSKLSATSAINQDIISSLPPVTITTVGRQLQGTVKRRIDNQILSKLLPLLQKVPSKSAVEIVAVELELEPLCILAAEMNRMLGLNKSSDFSRVVKLLMESDNSLGKKYITQVCETIVKITIKRVPVLFLYSHMIEQCQIVLNNFFVEKQ